MKAQENQMAIFMNVLWVIIVPKELLVQLNMHVQVCSFIMPLMPKMAPSRGHLFYIGLFRKKHENIFLA